MTRRPSKKVPAVPRHAVAIYKDNVKEVIDDGFVTAADLCKATSRPQCQAAGIS